MKHVLIVLVSFTLIVAACNNSPEADKSDPLESGRGFIEASLKGDYINAKKYILQDSTNIEYFDGLKNFNLKMSKEERRGYSEANIIIDSSIAESDSVDIIYYSNTYKNKPSKLKMVKHNNEWLVDFKYTFADN
ncbi:MAG: hypothetical protein ABI325_02045 [Ginsengibacter sp.]